MLQMLLRYLSSCLAQIGSVCYLDFKTNDSCYNVLILKISKSFVANLGRALNYLCLNQHSHPALLE